MYTYIDDLRNCLTSILKSDSLVYLIGEDISDPYGGAFGATKGLSSKYPDRLISTPMSEQGFTGLAIGLSLEGFKPIVEIMFGDFITLVADQLINHIAKFVELYNKKCNFVLRTPSGGYRGYGATHSQSLEKIFLGLPGIDICAPNVINRPGELLKFAINYGRPILFIENKMDYGRELIKGNLYKGIISIEFQNNSPISFGRASIKGEKPQFSIICYGGLVNEALYLIEKLYMDEEISIELISIPLISDIDMKELSVFIRSDKIITIEESHVNFGWGNYIVSSLLKFGNYTYFDILGTKLNVIPVAEELEKEVMFDINLLSQKIKNYISGYGI